MSSEGLVISKSILIEYENYNQKEVNIPEGIKCIDSGVFYNHAELAKITIPSSVVEIRSEVFSGCSGLTSIELPDGVISIGRYAFFNCANLIKIIIPSKVKEIEDHTFYDCTALENVEISGGITYIGEKAFSGCSRIKSIEIPDSVEAIDEEAFSDCSSLNSVIIPKNISEVGKDVFKGCEELTDVEIRNISIIAKEKLFSSGTNINHIKYYDQELNIIYDIVKKPFRIEIVMPDKSKYEVPEFAKYVQNIKGFKFSVNILINLTTPNSREQLCQELLVSMPKDNNKAFSGINSYCKKYNIVATNNKSSNLNGSKISVGKKTNRGIDNSTEIIINSNSFPNKYFRTWIIENVANNGYVLTEEMIEKVKTIDAEKFRPNCYDTLRLSLKGIEFFTNLIELKCYRCSIPYLDLSNNTNLTHLKLVECGLNEINLSANTELIDLTCVGNDPYMFYDRIHLTELDLSHNKKLKQIDCHNNTIVELTLDCPELFYLDCSYNCLSVLDLSNSPNLTDLNCDNNNLSELDLSKCPNCNTLLCHENKLKKLVLNKDSKLKQEECLYNQQIYYGL